MSDGLGLVRCVVCGEPIEMDEGDTLNVMETPDPDHPDFTEEDAREAMARALRRQASPESEMLAQAYENGEEITMHERCHDETALPDLYTDMEEFDDGE